MIKKFRPPYRLDRNKHGGGLLIYVREDIISVELTKHACSEGFESLFIELDFRKLKLLLNLSYNPQNYRISNHLEYLTKAIDFYKGKYDNILIIADLNAEMNEPPLRDFCKTYDLSNLIKEPTFFKSLNNPSSIDLMLTNRPRCFQNSTTFETGLSDFHKMTVSVLKTFVKKLEPIIINYRKLDHIDNRLLRREFFFKLKPIKQKLSLSSFTFLFTEVIDKLAPRKKKYVRANNANSRD